MKIAFTILVLLTAVACSCQEMIRVKILKIKTEDSITTVKIKTMKRPRVKLTTECKCVVPYRRKDIVWIVKPTSLNPQL